MSEARYTFTDGQPEAATPIAVAASPEIVPEPVAPAPDTPPVPQVDPPPELTEEERAEEAEAQAILAEEEAKHKGKSGSAKLKERLERERLDKADALARAERAEAALREAQKGAAPPPVAPAPPIAGLPTSDQFFTAYPQATLDDYEAFKLRFAVQLAKAEITQEFKAEKVKTQWEQKAARLPDFNTVQAVQAVKEAAGTTYGAAVWDSIEESDQGPEILDHLRKHPEDARRIAGLNERQAVKELGRLEERLASKATQKPKQTPAPPPITPIQTSSPVPQIDEKKKRYVEY